MQECSPKALLSTACTLWFKLLCCSSHCGSSSSLMCIPELERRADLLFFTSCSHVQPCRSRSGFAANSCGLIKTMIPDDYAYSQHEGSASCGASHFWEIFLSCIDICAVTLEHRAGAPARRLSFFELPRQTHNLGSHAVARIRERFLGLCTVCSYIQVNMYSCINCAETPELRAGAPARRHSSTASFSVKSRIS